MASSPSKRYPVSVAFSPPGGQVDKAQLLLDADRKAARVAQLLEDDRRAMEEESISQEWDIRWSSTRSQAAPENGAGETLSPAPSAGEGMLHPAHRPVKRDSPPSKSPPRQSPPRERPSQQPYHSFQGMAPSAELARAAGQALRGTPPRVPSEMLPDRSTLTPEDVQYARVRDLRERLVAFYRIFAPQKVARVDAILESFIVRGSTPAAMISLNEELGNAYGIDLDYQRRDKSHPDYLPRPQNTQMLYATQPNPASLAFHASRSPPPVLTDNSRLYSSLGVAPPSSGQSLFPRQPPSPAYQPSLYGSLAQANAMGSSGAIPPLYQSLPQQQHQQQQREQQKHQQQQEHAAWQRGAERQRLEVELRAVREQEARLKSNLTQGSSPPGGISPNQRLGGLLAPRTEIHPLVKDSFADTEVNARLYFDPPREPHTLGSPSIYSPKHINPTLVAGRR